jgi:plasmid stability protein
MPYQSEGCRPKNWVDSSASVPPASVRATPTVVDHQLGLGKLHGSLDCAIVAINAIIAGMASITIRRLPENTKRQLRIRAARNGRSMEQEARELIEAGLARADAEPENLGESIRRRFAPLGGVDLKIPARRGTIREIQFK